MRSSRQIAVTACVAVAFTLTGCAEDGPDPGRDTPSAVKLYGTDGNMQNSFASSLVDPSVLSGMKGTTPLTPLPTEFTNRLLEIDPSLEDFSYAGETYDAVAISVLAAELAGTPDPEQVRRYIKGVTTGGQQCETIAACLELARAGEELEYRGVSLRRGGFTDAGEPSTATYATQHFGVDGRIDHGKTEFVGAGDESATTTEKAPRPGPRPTEPVWAIEPLKLGGLLPETGALSLLFPPIHAGALLAVEEVNDAGGVFGVAVQWIDGDDGTSPDVAEATVASHVEEGVHIIIGAAASGVSEAVLPEVVAAKRILFSPSNTAAHLTDLDHDGYYFRTAPSDLLQGAALADIILRDGTEKVVIVAREDAYGEGLMQNTRDSLQRFGVPTEDVSFLTYPAVEDEAELIPNLAGLVDQIIAARPDGVLLIGFGELAQFIQAMIDAGLLLNR